ncbi:MAG: agglutinin biogenesis protein MshP [Burkholderiales bacterium]|nr:agglutinin biogenesis protein MshP [Burkholderiales bacterium]
MKIRSLISVARMRGFSLVTGIFLLVVLSALGAFMVMFTGLQQNTVQVDILGVRAYYAARAGLNWAMYRALDPDNPSATAAACPVGMIAQGALAGSLAPFSVNVECEPFDATEANRNIRVYRITATACNQAVCPGTPGNAYVERRVVSTLAKCKDPSAPSPFECGL